MLLEYFQMIDRITEVDLEEKVMRAQSTVPDESTVFEGHFPGHPLVPGVLMIETMAQCSGILIMHTIDFTRIPLLAGVKEGKLRDFVGPKAALEIKAEIEHEGSGFAVTRAEIRSSRVYSKPCRCSALRRMRSARSSTPKNPGLVGCCPMATIT